MGSGKTTVAHIFASLGIPVYDADSRAKKLMIENEELRSQIMRLLGEQAYREDGSLDRAFVASQVFNNAQKLGALNALVHPAVQKDGQRWHESQSGVPYTLREAALLIESGTVDFLDQLIVVTAPLDVRLKRVLQRDSISREQALARMDKQMDESEKVKHADFVIQNDGLHLLVPQVLSVHQELLRLAGADSPDSGFNQDQSL